MHLTEQNSLVFLKRLVLSVIVDAEHAFDMFDAACSRPCVVRCVPRYRHCRKFREGRATRCIPWTLPKRDRGQENGGRGAEGVGMVS